MDIDQSMPMPALIDPTLAYALEHDPPDPVLQEICQQDTTKWDQATASRNYELFREAAEAGSPFAMCICSRFCRAGWGQKASEERALTWVRESARKGFAPGLFELGSCYEQGVGVPIDLEEARRYYSLAVEGGFGFAGCHLAVMYHSGRFGPPDIIKALQYANLGYQLKDAMAPVLLGSWYENGEGVIRNQQEAVLWYRRAAELGNFFASDRLARAYARGELGLPKDAALAKKFESILDSQLPR